MSDVCGVQHLNKSANWIDEERKSASWAWQRIEFTETCGVMYWHSLAKLPHVLDTSLMGGK